ncbi:bifunctional 3-(3-hydroxy-phenyl)propionate/3-hydroxycinnamic acid hydroxylase [Nocardia cyriacigeorgica]|uniref:bifunctional 3-(3-hydroxy-phenyl)propionate/3-hydroxycinnamic acid hydroxylase MhpA n=1 Tax=Nocardia cyriacigeorgica TaxID=135487 RepID=UPI0018948773|nr:bifunctional 3-(3-hydroxy-phenyl)propionate/3-hydroxycinnamic acid hydroxylase [Nocardia cyriacigeorgica]MBF6454567.1 bifunctional 3-(3-hydroxy-phenyl)propionate/3-hydroxycinnamic acid hydroxylase [Nocardia cyriacigeorgica]MBF6479867.1 bifunctional 3-(3-hydroxy-phenyl)propionate/3-hydroxycinnamic acid hydroxylase [Nocardia cyriacigeorgica]MBF6552461.1 bifunctional 3-(3-hydroxy-phenyl)propionate/3-hydroxycinnamic acid hydroxylase [Nocardia cyriacigeorgica]
MNEFDHEVVIVGLGPTGLTLANLLGRHGIDALVLEREPEYYGLARAVYTDDECLRIFQTAGVADEIHAEMNLDSTVQWVRGDGRVLAQFNQIERPLSWPVTNFLYQPYLENSLERALERYPHVTVRRGRAVTGFEQDRAGVVVEHAECLGTGYGRHPAELAPGSTERVRAKFLVGCDGGRSVVRTQLGIDMSGTSFPERWLVVDLRARDGVDAFRHLPYFDFVCDPELPIVSCPQPDRHHRFEFMLRADQTGQEMEDPQTVRRHIARYVDPDEVEVLRKLVYTFNAVVADRWRADRILIAGDAAHMTPQFIGQGMNSGVRDADNLSWKLAAILRFGADPAILDSYESERRPHAKAMIDLSVVNKNVVSLRNRRLAAVRDALLATTVRMPGLGGWIRQAKFKPAPRFRRGAYLGLPRRGLRGIEGGLSPQPQVRSYDGRHSRLDDHLGLGFAVLGYGTDPRGAFTATDLDVLRALDTRFVSVYPLGGRPRGKPGDGRDDVVDLEDHTGALMRWFGTAKLRPGGVVLMRPDRFVFGAATPERTGELVAALRRQLHLSATISDREPSESIRAEENR